MLHKTIKNDYQLALRNKSDKATLSAYRVIIGEIERSPTKTMDDRQIMSSLKKQILDSKAQLEYDMQDDPTDEEIHGHNVFIRVAESYVPVDVQDGEIVAYIFENIDLELSTRDRMKHMKSIMSHFGGRANGKKVKEFLTNMKEDGSL